MTKGDYSANTLKLNKDKIDKIYVKDELWKVRNFHQSFRNGLLDGFFYSGLQELTGGAGIIDPMHAHAAHEAYKPIFGRPPPDRVKGDGKLTIGRLTDGYHSRTSHD